MKPLISTRDYSNKSQHGIKWGLNVFRGQGYRIKLQSLGGDLERLAGQDITALTKDDRVLMMGNAWIHRDPRDRTWHDPKTVIPMVREFYFWDNPPIPQILYRNLHNPVGHKNWMRIVPGGIMPQPLWDGRDHQARINDQLRQCSGGKITSWLDLVDIHRDCQPRGRRVLIILSSSQVYERYALTTKQQWRSQVEHECRQQGLEPVIRDKHSRNVRHHQGELNEVLKEPWYCTISFQSMSVVESLAQGVPAVAYLGDSALRDLTTPWSEFQRGQLRVWHRDHCLDQISGLLSQCWHKQEAYEGEWHA